MLVDTPTPGKQLVKFDCFVSNFLIEISVASFRIIHFCLRECLAKHTDISRDFTDMDYTILMKHIYLNSQNAFDMSLAKNRICSSTAGPHGASNVIGGSSHSILLLGVGTFLDIASHETRIAHNCIHLDNTTINSSFYKGCDADTEAHRAIDIA